MAVTFLVISRHEGAQVDTLTQQAGAKNSAESGRQQAMAQAIAQMLANTNGLNGEFVQSRPTFQSSCFLTTATVNGGYNAITNVNYYDQNGALLTGGNYLQMLSNQVILPRPPVFISTNKLATRPLDFRYWLDLNRNAVYDTNGVVYEVDANGNLVTNIYVGDPEWVGILSHPEQRHGPNNSIYVRALRVHRAAHRQFAL